MGDGQANQTEMRLSWPMVAAVLTAMTALYSTGRSPALPLAALAVIASCLTTTRLPRHALLLWTIRLVLFGLVLLTADLRDVGIKIWYMRPGHSSLLGFLCAIELAIQCWQQRVPADEATRASKRLASYSEEIAYHWAVMQSSSPRGPVMVLSGLVMAAATTVYENTYIRFLAPAYILFAVFAFRSFRPHDTGQDPATKRPAALGLRAGAIALTLGLGYLAVLGFESYARLLNKLDVNLVSLLMRPSSSYTGLSGAPMLEHSTAMTPSPVRVMRVDGLVGDGHLRGLTFDSYSGNRWAPTFEERKFEPVTDRQLNSAATGKQLTVTRFIDDGGLLCAPLESAGLSPMAGSDTQWHRDGPVVRSLIKGVSEYVFQVTLSRQENHQGPLSGGLTAIQRDRCLAIPPEIDPQVRQMATQIATAADAAGKARQIERYLQKNYKYSLKIDVYHVGDRISFFLLNKHAAHCQFFASSAVMLLRCAGIPARFVTGYYAHEPSGRDSLIVRQRDAHAWTEAWIDGVGWITLDATPSDGRPDQALPPVSSLRKLWEWISDTTRAIADWLGGLSLAKVLMFLGSLATVVIIIQWMRLLLRRRQMVRATSGDAYRFPDVELAEIAAEFQKLLAGTGMPCPAHRTWRQHLAEIGSLDAPAPLDMALADEFAQRYESARFGHHAPNAAEPGLRDALRELDSSKRMTKGSKNP